MQIMDFTVLKNFLQKFLKIAKEYMRVYERKQEKTKDYQGVN